MKLNKRTVAVAALSVSLVAPTISPVSHAQEKQLNCSNGVEKGDDFDAETGEVHLAEQLKKLCDSSAENSDQLYQEEHTAVEAANYEPPSASGEDLLHMSQSPAPVRETESGNGSEQELVHVAVDQVREGDRTVRGRVKLPAGVKEQTISVTFLSRVFPQIVTVTRSSADKTGWVPFELNVQESIELHVGDKILVGPVPAMESQKQIIEVAARDHAPAPMQPESEIRPEMGRDQKGHGQATPGAPRTSHLNCERRFEKGRDFSGVPSFVVISHLKRNCGLTDQQILALSPEDLRKIAAELNEQADAVNLSLIRAILNAKTRVPGRESQAERQSTPARITENERQDALQKLAAANAINPEQRKAFTKDIADASDVERLRSIKQAIDAENSNPLGKLAPKKSLKPQAPKKNPESNNEDLTKKPNPNKESGNLDFEDNEVFSPNQKEWTAKDFVNPFKQHEKNEAGQELQETKRAASAAIDGIQNLSDEHKAAYKGVIASATSIEQIELLVHGALETSDSAVENGKVAGPFGIDENPLYSPNEKQWTSKDFLNSFKQHEKNEAAKVAEETMLKEAKRQAHATINGIKGLTEKHRTDYKVQIDAATNQEAVQRIVEVAQKSSTTDTGDVSENQPPKNGGNSGGTDNGNSAGEHENIPDSSASNAKGIAAIAAGFGALGLAIGGILSAVNYFGGLNTIRAKIIDMLTSIGVRF
ncbi:GA module-containing protein [Corynebacterium propinquum]|uniref:GA module-containing protein n=1 Tax=Corynebacterium propinquum TaxID=43769 RepID=UPI0025424EED|nr:GA module-containing protein [Corynebacterium propinquum]MDK4257233.1 GA module-containing protein [Corynebacterium propinquum]MDK4282447.1 GA module-containing protein [Corynebacterium propinquum]MDK4298429.1 GA module-containing protein [Corynebacterium propinquum]